LTTIQGFEIDDKEPRRWIPLGTAACAVCFDGKRFCNTIILYLSLKVGRGSHFYAPFLYFTPLIIIIIAIVLIVSVCAGKSPSSLWADRTALVSMRKKTRMATSAHTDMVAQSNFRSACSNDPASPFFSSPLTHHVTPLFSCASCDPGRFHFANKTNSPDEHRDYGAPYIYIHTYIQAASCRIKPPLFCHSVRPALLFSCSESIFTISTCMYTVIIQESQVSYRSRSQFCWIFHWISAVSNIESGRPRDNIAKLRS
jgi:hypothetical protein